MLPGWLVARRRELGTDLTAGRWLGSRGCLLLVPVGGRAHGRRRCGRRSPSDSRQKHPPAGRGIELALPYEWPVRRASESAVAMRWRGHMAGGTPCYTADSSPPYDRLLPRNVTHVRAPAGATLKAGMRAAGDRVPLGLFFTTILINWLKKWPRELHDGQIFGHLLVVVPVRLFQYDDLHLVVLEAQKPLLPLRNQLVSQAAEYLCKVVPVRRPQQRPPSSSCRRQRTAFCSWGTLGRMPLCTTQALS